MLIKNSSHYIMRCVTRPATAAIEHGSQIADRFSIIRSWEQKKTRFQRFHIS